VSLDPGSGALHRNHALMAGSMLDDFRHELGINDHADYEAMGWEQPGASFIGGSVEWGTGVFKSLLAGQIRGNFG